MAHFFQDISRAAVLSCGVLFAGVAGALPITVVNHSFEETTGSVLLFNEFSFGPFVGWDLYESSGGQTSGGAGPDYYVGTLEPTGGVFITAGATDGDRVGIAYNTAASGGGGEYGLVQTITTDQLQPMTRYTVTVDVINIASGTAVNNAFFNLAGFPGYRIDLLAGGVAIASDSTSAGIPIEGGYATATLVFETGVSHSQLGQDLGIRLVNLNVVDTTDATTTAADLEVDFDNVRLDAVPVPEPKSLAVLVIAGLVVVSRRRACDRANANVAHALQ